MRVRKRVWAGVLWGFAPVLLLAASCGETSRPGENAGGSGGAGSGCPGKAASCAGASGTTTAGSSASGGDDLGGAGDGATAGAGGGSAAGMGSGGDAGGTANGGDAGVAGQGGDGGGAPGSVIGTDCNGNTFEVQAERLNLCVMLASCAGPRFTGTDSLRGNSSTGFCVADGPALPVFSFSTHRAGEPPLELDARAATCLSSIHSCDDVLACAGYRKPLQECDRGASTRCDGERAINCGDPAVVTDCKRATGVEGTCKVAVLAGGEKRAVCDTGQACASASSPPACLGDTLYSCEGGLSNVTNCAEFGLTCHEYVGFAACVTPPPTAPCTELDTPGCKGSKLTYCSPDGVLYEHECVGAAPLTCFDSPGDLPSDIAILECVPEGCGLGEGTFEDDVCAGDDLQLGIPGGIVLHCPDYGFATCRNGVCAN